VWPRYTLRQTKGGEIVTDKKMEKFAEEMSSLVTIYLDALDGTPPIVELKTIEACKESTSSQTYAMWEDLLEKPTEDKLIAALMHAAFLIQVGVVEEYIDNEDELYRRLLTINAFISGLIRDPDTIVGMCRGSISIAKDIPKQGKLPVEATSFLKRFIMSTEVHTRWPCPYCGRENAGAPLRIINVETECGRKYRGGCLYCAAVDKYIREAKELLEESRQEQPPVIPSDDEPDNTSQRS
jgi:hypothetical protein